MGILTGCMLRPLPDTVPDYNFSLGVVQLLHDDSGMMRKEASNAIDSYLYTMYVYLCNINVICTIPHIVCCEIVVCWIQVLIVI
jgi:hypothetical protein